MADVDLLVIFNHRHEEVLDAVLDYNRRFSDNVVAAAPFAAPDVVQYSSGVFLAQGAIVEYLAGRRFRGDYTLVIHDDLVLNPALHLEDLVPAGDDVVRMYRTRLLAGTMTRTWSWQLRVLTNWLTPRSNPFGTGVNDPADLLRSSLLHRRNRDVIEALGTSRLTVGEDPASISAVLAAWIETHFPGQREFDLGLPLFMGNADYLLFPNHLAPLIEDFLRRTIECGLMSEVAVPTLANWLGLPLEHDSERQYLRTGTDWFTDVTSVGDIESLFSRDPHLISVHPIKFSRFTHDR
jgi:hypothetical protein